MTLLHKIPIISVMIHGFFPVLIMKKRSSWLIIGDSIKYKIMIASKTDAIKVEFWGETT